MSFITRRQREWYFIQQQLRNIKLRTPTVITTSIKAAIFGDSITAQNTTFAATSQYFNSIGYMQHLNYRTNHRYVYSANDNYGVSGGDLAGMDARKATDLGGKGYNMVFFCGGANNSTATTTLAQMVAYATSIINYITITLGAYCIIMPPPPRTQDGGVPLTADMIQKMVDFRAALRSLADGKKSFYAPYFSSMTTDGSTPDPVCFKNESGKLLHPTPEGARRMGVALDGVLTPVFGKADMPVDNILGSVGTLIGTSGIISTNNSGVLATGWTGSGSGGVNGRVLSKNTNGSQKVAVNLPDGAGAAAGETVEVTIDPTTGYAVGDILFGWLDINMIAGSFADGPYLEVREQSGTQKTYLGMNKAGSTTGFMPLAAMGRGLIRTPNFVVQSGNTKLEYLVRSQAFASGQASSQEFDIYAAGITKVTA